MISVIDAFQLVLLSEPKHTQHANSWWFFDMDFGFWVFDPWQNVYWKQMQFSLCSFYFSSAWLFCLRILVDNTSLWIGWLLFLERKGKRKNNALRSFYLFGFCRHHVYEKRGGPKSIELKEVGPRFEMRLYQVSNWLFVQQLILFFD